MKIKELVDANALVDDYDKYKQEIIRTSFLYVVTLNYSGGPGSSQREIRSGDRLNAVKVAIIRSIEAQASAVLGKLNGAGVNITGERERLDSLVNKAIAGPITDGVVEFQP